MLRQAIFVAAALFVGLIGGWTLHEAFGQFLRQTCALGYLMEAEDAREQGNEAKADAWYHASRNTLPEWYAPDFMLGKTYFDMESYDLAIFHFAEVEREFDPDGDYPLFVSEEELATSLKLLVEAEEKLATDD